MQSRLKVRLERLEHAARQTRFRKDPELNADLACLGSFELRRARDALRLGINGDEIQAAEAGTLLKLAHERRLEGWTEADTDTLNKQDREKRDAAWRFIHALGERHKAYLAISGFDVLDLDEAEIKQLAEVAERATSASDLEPTAEVVRRLRIDGHVVDMAEFEALILRGEIAQPPPPDCLEFA